MKPYFALILIPILMLGCASSKPILYPNAHYEAVGESTAKDDIVACENAAEAAGAQSPGSSAGNAAKNTAVGAGLGAATGAVGGAIVGSAGTGSLIGAASGATAGLLRWIFTPAKRSPAYTNFVDRCLTEKNYDVIGWN